jgi:hypothetical protein
VTEVGYAERDGAVLVPLKVVPGASRSRVVGVLGDRVKVAVASPPEQGAANDEVCRVLAALLGVKPSAVRVTAGHGSPRKTVSVVGVTLSQVRTALEGPRR